MWYGVYVTREGYKSKLNHKSEDLSTFIKRINDNRGGEDGKTRKGMWYGLIDF